MLSGLTYELPAPKQNEARVKFLLRRQAHTFSQFPRQIDADPAVRKSRIDGDANGPAGGNYLTSFVAAPSANVLTVPDFMRGPGQPADVPANGAGIPLVLAWSGAPVSSLSFVLTYDDGPTPGVTDRLLPILAEAGATATFFVLLTRVRAHPSMVAELLAAGHEVALHGIDHVDLTSLPLWRQVG